MTGGGFGPVSACFSCLNLAEKKISPSCLKLIVCCASWSSRISILIMDLLQVAADGYGVSYIIASEDLIFFHISSNKSSPITVKCLSFIRVDFIWYISRIRNALVNKFVDQWKICGNYSMINRMVLRVKVIRNSHQLPQQLNYQFNWLFYSIYLTV